MDEQQLVNVAGGNGHHVVSITVEVNDQPVVLNERRLTGSQIKAAAIAQGVVIQPSFQLILKRPGEASKVIGDDETLAVHDGMVFKAIPADDNS
ncbi:multiubiquitin domain-containing protein [Ralstonia sp. R-29]|uniref:multiubiquitin domain-containing protein n=1 Tax=Ralstonia sp. R-29 TaxID=3404059 RepID=UPI003CF79ED2